MLEVIKGIGLIIYFCCGWQLTTAILAKMGIVTYHASIGDWFIGRFIGALFLGAVGVPYYAIKLVIGLFSGGSKSE